MAAIEITERHMELYEQINKQTHIRGTNLVTSMKLPALEITTEKPINNMVFLTTLKNILKLGQKNTTGSHTLYIAIGGRSVELGKVTLTSRLIHTILSMLVSFTPAIYGIDSEKGRFEIGDDEIAEILFT